MESQVLYAVTYGLATLVLGWLIHLIYKWMHAPCNGRLPPGSMGLPIVGETFQFFKSSSCLDIPEFYKLRLKRYGPLFKTSLVGKPIIVSMDMEVNRFIFREEGKLFQFWFPESANKILGQKSTASYCGSIHKYIRRIAAPQFAPQNLKGLIGEMESTVTKCLRTWAAKPSIDMTDAATNMTFDLIAKKIIGFEPIRSRELRKRFDVFYKGLFSFPLYIPGTKFYRSMQERKHVQKVLIDLIQERINAPEKRYGDFLDILVDELRTGSSLVDDNFVADSITGLLLASIASLPQILTMAVKFLTESPNVVEALMEEHEAILKKREARNSVITWDEYRSMKFTFQVVNEIIRLGGNAPGIFRKTLKDVKVNGYTIPAGWLVMMSPVAIHLSPNFFKDPLTFNPWRWQEANGSSLSKYFMPFGDGIRHCMGAEFSKLQIALFLHTLVVQYRWKEVRGAGIFRISQFVFPQGYHIQLFPRT